MNSTTDSFYTGLIAGVLVCIVLNTVKNYVFNNYGRNTGEKSIENFFNSSVNGQFKIALLVRHDLKMGKGKVAAQCSHAIVHCYEEGLRLKATEINGWEYNNKPVDIFQVSDEETLLKYQQLAICKGFNTYVVVDAGRTQVAPRSKTVLAIGPAISESIDLFTRDLQCAVVSVNAFNKSELCGLPSKCARIVLRAPDLKTLECIKKQCKLFGIQTTSFIENDQMTVLAIGPANEDSINAQVHHLKLY